MKVGDVVRCTWQPRTSHVENDCAVPMKLTIKGELGIIVEVRDNGFHWRIAFPSLSGYTHTLSQSAFETVNA
jgi:hypothetical protein